MTSSVPRLALYGRTYLDAEVEVPLAVLGEGKGKLDTEVRAIFGGFACNAARALGTRLPSGSVRLVTVTSWLDWPRLRAGLPERIALDAIVDDATDGRWPPISVIINPSGACRLLRGRAEQDAASWSVDRVASGALGARLHAVGRLPIPFVAALLDRSRASDARVAWCGGDALPRELETRCHLLCVNTAEASRLLGATGRSPSELARELARRAPPGAVRLVTGRGDASPVAAVRGPRGVRLHEGARPVPIPPSKVRRFKGVGDAFAAHFLVEACFDARGTPRRRLEVGGALRSAQRAAAKFIRTPPDSAP